MPQSGCEPRARILVLVERRTVEAAECELVAREVRRHPVQDHADPGPVERVDERPEVVGLAHRRHRRVEARHLVPPRPGERVVHDRHELDVREAELVGVARQAAPRAPSSRGQAATTRRAPRRSRAAPSAVVSHGDGRARRCRSIRSATCRSSKRSSAAPRRRRRRGRPSDAAARRRRVPRTCSRRLPRPRARPPTRSRRSRAARAGSPSRPSGSSRRRPRRRARWVPRRRTTHPRRRHGRRVARRSARAAPRPRGGGPARRFSPRAPGPSLAARGRRG